MGSGWRDKPEDAEWMGDWEPLDDPIWKWYRYYRTLRGAIGCCERRELPERADSGGD